MVSSSVGGKLNLTAHKNKLSLAKVELNFVISNVRSVFYSGLYRETAKQESILLECDGFIFKLGELIKSNNTQQHLLSFFST